MTDIEKQCTRNQCSFLDIDSAGAPASTGEVRWSSSARLANAMDRTGVDRRDTQAQSAPCRDSHGKEGGYFSFERLDVYRVAQEFRAWVVHDLLPRIPKGEADSRDQLRRASRSIPFNIAEGAEQESQPMARKHYRIAKASAGECCAVLDDLEILGVPELEPGFRLIRRIGAMLRQLAR